MSDKSTLRVGSLAIAKRTTGVCDAGERGVCYEEYTLPDGKDGRRGGNRPVGGSGQSPALSFSLAQQRPRVAGTVQHPHDDDLAVRVAVVEGVLLVKMYPQAGREIFPARSQLRLNQQRLKAGLDFAHARRSGSGTSPLGDERPNLDQILFGLLGEAEAAGGVNRWRPV